MAYEVCDGPFLIRQKERKIDPLKKGGSWSLVLEFSPERKQLEVWVPGHHVGWCGTPPCVISARMAPGG